MLNSNAKYWVTACSVKVYGMQERKCDDCTALSACRSSECLQEKYV